MAGQSATMTVGEVASTISKLEKNQQNVKGSSSGHETDAQVGRKNTPQPKKA